MKQCDGAHGGMFGCAGGQLSRFWTIVHCGDGPNSASSSNDVKNQKVKGIEGMGFQVHTTFSVTQGNLCCLKKRNMTPEMEFECLLVSHDPAVFCTMDRILQDFSIHTNLCENPSKAANLLTDGATDLIVIDLESEHSSELMQQILELRMRQKPTILAVSETDSVMPGVHVILRKPVTPESGAKSLRAAYSRMLQDYRKHTRFALMAHVLATDENDRQLSVTVSNVGEGGVGLITQEKLEIGGILSFQVQLPDWGGAIRIQARVLWTREYGAVGCEFVRIARGDLQLLHAWLESRYRFKKPVVPG